MSKKITNRQKQIRWLLISIAVIVVALITLKIVNAQSWTFEITPNKTEAMAGEEVELSMKILDIDMGNLRNKCNRINIGI